MTDTFFTLKTLCEGIYKDKGSKFLSFAMPIADSKTAIETVKEYRKRFYDARHVCFAFKIGTENPEIRTNDDGEPSGTAGQPILGQINSANLTNVLIIVVRYFGGVLLGTGGLRLAYKNATVDALKNGKIIEQIIENQIIIKFLYSFLNNILKIIKYYNLRIISQKIETDCTIQIAVRKSLTEIVTQKFTEYGDCVILQN